MRTIEISTEVFARVWALRRDGEESEDAILKRVLPPHGAQDMPHLKLSEAPKAPTPAPDGASSLVARKAFYDRGPRTWSQPTWATDLAEVLTTLGGQASLHRIYAEVAQYRRKEGRSVPKQLEATVRRTLENHSSQSDNFTGGADLFYMPQGKGSGVWALR